MRVFCFLPLLLLLRPALAQEPVNLRRAKLDPVDSVTVMPPDALDSTVTGLLVGLNYPYPPGRKVAPRGYAFRWPYESIDGSLSLYINRRQLYLRTNHNNPNPNALYWVQNLTPAQYQRIAAVLRRPTAPFQTSHDGADLGYYRDLKFQPKATARQLPETERQWKAFRAREEQDLAQRVIRLLQQLNTALPADAQLTVPTPKSLFAQSTRIAYSVAELFDMRPYLPEKKPVALNSNFTLRSNATLTVNGQTYRLDADYDFAGFQREPTAGTASFRWQRKPAASAKLPATLTLVCAGVDEVRETGTGAGQRLEKPQPFWFAYQLPKEDTYELLLGLESGRTFHISCAEARLTATP